MTDTTLAPPTLKFICQLRVQLSEALQLAAGRFDQRRILCPATLDWSRLIVVMTGATPPCSS